MPFRLRRSRRRRTLGLTVTAQEVRIHAPVWTPRDEIETYVLRQHDWLMRAWHKMQARAPRGAAAREMAITYLGQTLRLELHVALFREACRQGRVLHLYAEPGADPHQLARDWLIRRAERLLAWRLQRLARRLGRMPSRFTLSDARTQWGSCTRRGHIRLNWRLAQAPLSLIDYVAAHELAHLVHLDHSPRFWAQVSELCADARARRAALRRMGDTFFRI
ncbi:MAG: M48 family metallopeptidase [Thiobacillus sp.]|nr:M48 family metallopeptidase [Thiobacillus sp.]